MPEVPKSKLKTGGEIPVVGFGTAVLGEKLENSVRNALDNGYTYLDTAEGYHNEERLGKILKDYDRENLFITSKVLPSNLNYGQVLESCDRSLAKLGTSYLDLYLIHWPNPAISLRETLNAFKKLYDSGKIKNIGVSNFNLYQLRVARRISEVPISINQVEFHPWYHDEKLLSYCKENDIYLNASAPLARTAIFQDSLVNELADKYAKSPAQVVLRWQVQKDVITIPRSSSKEHIKQNIDIFDFELESSEIEDIDNIPKEKRCDDYMIDLSDDTYGIPS